MIRPRATCPASTSSSAAAAAHTTVAAARRPGTVTGRLTAAVATMPVPITAANQFGPRATAGAAAGRPSSVVMGTLSAWRAASGSRMVPMWS